MRIPLDTWAPPPQFAGRPRTHVEMLLVRVGTNAGVVGWGESFGSNSPLIPAAFDAWIKHLAIGQDATDVDLTARIERLLHGLFAEPQPFGQQRLRDARPVELGEDRGRSTESPSGFSGPSSILTECERPRSRGQGTAGGQRHS